MCSTQAHFSSAMRDWHDFYVQSLCMNGAISSFPKLEAAFYNGITLIGLGASGWAPLEGTARWDGWRPAGEPPRGAFFAGAKGRPVGVAPVRRGGHARPAAAERVCPSPCCLFPRWLPRGTGTSSGRCRRCHGPHDAALPARDVCRCCCRRVPGKVSSPSQFASSSLPHFFFLSLRLCMLPHEKFRNLGKY